MYTAEQLPHVRIEACETCRVYVKSVDLTRNGLAVPEVDEAVPVVGVGQAIDLPHELVEITELDQLLVVHPVRRAARDTDEPIGPMGRRGA